MFGTTTWGTIQKYLIFFKKRFFLKLILSPTLFFEIFSSGLVFPAGLNPLPLSPKGKRKELQVFPNGPLDQFKNI